MCDHIKFEKHGDCKYNSANELKCCCTEKPDSEEVRQHMKECAEALRKKADYIEKKISG
jgi:hypothetical protein